MFQRVIVADWAHCLPIVSFCIFAAVFVVVSLRALRLDAHHRARLAAMPLDPAPEPDPDSEPSPKPPSDPS